MKIESPPAIHDQSFDRYFEFISDHDLLHYLIQSDKKYFYWSEIKHRKDSPFKNPYDEWYATKMYRKLNAQPIKFNHHRFTYNLTESIQADLHNFDLKLVGGFFKEPMNVQIQQDFFKNSLIDEAIASSQIEGAATTTEVAKKMIKSGRKARNESEQMILNNWRAIQEIGIRLEEPLNPDLIFDIHKIMTHNTSAEKYADTIRNQPVFVVDHVDGEVAFEAPQATEVNDLMQRLIFFINEEESFVHPIIKASILHFLVGYIHPFGDGNGRTARALFYWFLIKKGYTLLRHISISKAILESRTSYDKAFLQTEHDENDMTYFIKYSMKTLKVAFQNLIDYKERKESEREQQLQLKDRLIEQEFNPRQADLLAYFYLKPRKEINVNTYSERYDVVRQTASRDLTRLKELGILKRFKDGKNTVFSLTNKNHLESYLH